MKQNIIFILVFLNSIFFSISYVQNWNFQNSAIDLLSASDTASVSIKVLEETKDNLYVKLYKYIAKENGEVVYRKYLTVKYNNATIYDGQVDFDGIESYHRFGVDNIICPKGKYHPIYYYEGGHSYLNLSSFSDNRDWELKCMIHEQGYFMIFYLMNGESSFFYKKYGESNWRQMQTYQEIYGVKLGNNMINDNDQYRLVFVAKDGGWLKLIGAKCGIKKNYEYINRVILETKGIINARANTRGCFENNNEHFYFLTYTNTSDFACGYYDSSDSIDYLNIRQVIVNRSEESPLEFIDEVEIEYIKFINDYKYAYYKINNLATGSTYYGIIDTKKNIVVFNTEEEILTYVPYTDISMLAITSTTAYEICVIKQNGTCIDSIGCTETNYNYIADLEGNNCATSCEDGKILLLRENMCSDTCDESIYVLHNSQCGLCKQIYPDKPYKLINASGCLATNDIPEGAELNYIY